MPNLVDIISDTFPANDDTGVPLLTAITISFDQEMNETRLQEDFFIEGPDTDQLIGAGLLELTHPNNVSQGDIDGFLKSPGYKGIVQGTYDFDLSTSGVDTVLRFTPDEPLAASTVYTAVLSDTLNLAGTEYTGHLIFSWTTGTGSIEEIPADVSSSVLSSTAATVATTSVITGAGSSTFGITETTPTDRTVEHSIDTSEIVVTFNKNLDASTVTADKIAVTATPVTDHPNASAGSERDIAKAITVAGNKLTIRI